MEKRKPILSDLEEFKIIKQIYFNKDLQEDTDLSENYERRDCKQRNFNKNSR